MMMILTVMMVLTVVMLIQNVIGYMDYIRHKEAEEHARYARRMMKTATLDREEWQG